LQNVFLCCPTPRLHCFLSSHWSLFRFLSFMAFLIPSSQFFFGLPRAHFCFGIHFNAILGNLPSANNTLLSIVQRVSTYVTSIIRHQLKYVQYIYLDEGRLTTVKITTV